MKNLYYLLFFSIFCCCGENKSHIETPNREAKVDSLTVGLEAQTFEIDFYSNYENKNIQELISITSAEATQISKSTTSYFNVKNAFASDSTTINLFNENGELIFSTPKNISSEESNITVTYLGYSKSFGFHLLKYYDPIAPFSYYDMIGTQSKDTTRFNSMPKINSDGILIDIIPNIHDDLTYFSLYKIQKGKLELIFRCDFDSWMATQYDEDIWWSTDNAFIVPYWHTETYWENKDKKPDKMLKLTIKNV